MTVMYPNGGEVTGFWTDHSDLRNTHSTESLMLHTVATLTPHSIPSTWALHTFSLDYSRLPGHLAVWKWSQRQGFVCALFEKGSWMLILIGGFLAATHSFLLPHTKKSGSTPIKTILT